MPIRARAWLATPVRSVSPKRMLPPLGLRIPMIVFMSVVLPAPLRPMRPIIDPVGNSRETPRRMWTAAMETLRSWTLSTSALQALALAHHVPLHVGIGQHDRRRRVGDDAAVIEGEDPLRKAAHHLHVVLDEEHCGAFGAHRVEDHLHDAE